MNDLTTRSPAWHLPALKGAADCFDLRRLWLAVRLRKWTVLAALAAALALTGLLLAQLTPLYTARAVLMIERQAPLIHFSQAESEDGKLDSYLATQLDLLRSRGVADRVVRELALAEHPEFDPRPHLAARGLVGWLRGVGRSLGLRLDDPPMSEAEIHELATLAFMQRTEVRLQGKGELLHIEVTMADAATAARAANALAGSYIESQLAAKVDMSMTAANWMNGRLSQLRATLEASERRLQAYLEAQGLVNLNGVATVSKNELSLTGDRMIEASRARAEAESLYRQVSDLRGQGWERLASLPAILDNKLVQDFKAEVAQARARVEDLSRRYGDRHPALQSARSDLNAATQSLRSQIEQVAAGLERNYQLALANERALRASFNDNKADIQDIGRKEFQVRELQREVESNRALYDTFATRLRETNATSDLASTNARLVDPAKAPQEPSAPRTGLYLGVAALLGLLLGVGGALLLEVLNDTFKHPDEVEAKLDLPVMGVVPLLAGEHGSQAAQFFRRNLDRRFSEAIRTIRTNITLADAGRRQVLMITSSEPDEGKTSLSSNLAFAMGQLQRVLLIDADLRRPSLARAFQLPAGAPGLANILAGSAKAEHCIRELDGISLLPAGTVPPDPQELLASPRFAELLRQLRSHYDRILIDTPPTLAVSDTALLAGAVDGAIYLIRADHTAVPLARQGIGQLVQAGVRLTGVVLNRFDVQRARRYQPYSGYYDDYGYSDNTPHTPPATVRAPTPA